MNQDLVPSAPPLGPTGGNVSTAPPSYDEAVGNIASGPAGDNITNPAQVAASVQEEKEKKEKGPPVTTQPQPQPQTTYTFEQPSVNQNPAPGECYFCCLWCDGTDIADLCYCIFCCSRCIAEREGCCEGGDCCCSCLDVLCNGGHWNCGDCNCDCGDCGDCSCDCGDCTII